MREAAAQGLPPRSLPGEGTPDAAAANAPSLPSSERGVLALPSRKTMPTSFTVVPVEGQEPQPSRPLEEPSQQLAECSSGEPGESAGPSPQAPAGERGAAGVGRAAHLG